MPTQKPKEVNIRYVVDSSMKMKGEPANLKDATYIKECVQYKDIAKGGLQHDAFLTRENKQNKRNHQRDGMSVDETPYALLRSHPKRHLHLQEWNSRSIWVMAQTPSPKLRPRVFQDEKKEITRDGQDDAMMSNSETLYPKVQ